MYVCMYMHIIVQEKWRVHSHPEREGMGAPPPKKKKDS